MNRIISSFIVAILGAPLSQAWADDAVDGVIVKDHVVYFMRGETLEALTENLRFSFGVEIAPNGEFRVADGKVRSLQEGQIIRRDGWLVNPDGAVQPVFDHVAMKEGKVLVVRDGQAEALAGPTLFPNNLNVNPDGSCVYPSGSRTRLMDGQLFRLDGTPIPSKDTATVKNGRVVVQKEGSLIRLSSIQIMGMNDGTRVQGDGYVQRMDGTKTKLREGQTILIEGAAVRR
jgi:hypothetical protein